MDISFDFMLMLISRWLHILAAITAVGGTIFIRYALMPTLATLPDEQRQALHASLRARWSKAVMISIVFLLASGLYNFIMINRGLGAGNEAMQGMKPMYHALFGVKFLLALGIFFIASALVGRSAAFEKVRGNAKLWATVNISLAVALVCLSSFMRLSRDQAAATAPPVTQQSARSRRRSRIRGMTRPDKELASRIRRYFSGAPPAPIERWPAERLHNYQRDTVAEQLAHVYAANDFYREKFNAAGAKPDDFHKLGDLTRFPFTHKDELRGKPWVLLSVPKSDVCLTHTSTGTTGGVWSYVHYSWDDMHVRDWAPFPHELMGIRDSDVVINALPYEMSSAGQSFQRSLQGAAGAQVVPVGKGGFYSDADKTVQVMADLAADVLITTPPYAMLLSEVAGAIGKRPGQDLRLRFIWLTGEGCSGAYRRRLEERWKCPALVFYGSLECGPIGIEYQQQQGCHVSAGHVYLEIVDPQTGQPKPPGEVGEVVCTTLLRQASPLIRYRTQDLAMIDPAPCACGVVFPKVHIRGRIVDQVPQQGPAADAVPAPVSPYMIEDVLYSQSAMGGNYQIYADGASLRIEAELTEGASGDAARPQIIEALGRRGVQADLVWVDHIPRTGGKTRRIRPATDRGAVMAERCVLRAALKP